MGRRNGAVGQAEKAYCTFLSLHLFISQKRLSERVACDIYTFLLLFCSFKSENKMRKYPTVVTTITTSFSIHLLIIITLISVGVVTGSTTKVKPCSTHYVPMERFNLPPKIIFEYDGRRIDNKTIKMTRKSVTRENSFSLICRGNYPVKLTPTEGIVDDSQALKQFKDNSDTYCILEGNPDLSFNGTPPCKHYEDKSTLPLHFLIEKNISATCESYCSQVLTYVSIHLYENQKKISGDVTDHRVEKRGNVSKDNRTWEEVLQAQRAQGKREIELVTQNEGAPGKAWLAKCKANSSRTVRGAILIVKFKDSGGFRVENSSKEYRKAYTGEHSIRTTIKESSSSVDSIRCLFPLMEDFLWLEKEDQTSIKVQKTYWECVLHLCGAFGGLFGMVSVVLYSIHRWLHSDCCHLLHHDHRSEAMSMAGSARSSRQQLHIHQIQKQWSSSVEGEDQAEDEYFPEESDSNPSESSQNYQDDLRPGNI